MQTSSAGEAKLASSSEVALETKKTPPEGAPLEAVRQALVAVSSVRSLLARKVLRAIVGRIASAASLALKR